MLVSISEEFVRECTEGAVSLAAQRGKVVLEEQDLQAFIGTSFQSRNMQLD